MQGEREHPSNRIRSEAAERGTGGGWGGTEDGEGGGAEEEEGCSGLPWQEGKTQRRRQRDVKTKRRAAAAASTDSTVRRLPEYSTFFPLQFEGE